MADVRGIVCRVSRPPGYAASIAAAAAHVGEKFGRLDVLVQNAAISNTRKQPGQSVEDYSETTRPSIVDFEEMRAVWETNVFGVLRVHQATLPLLLAVIEAVRDSGLAQAELARRLGKDAREVRSILDPDHHTKIPALTAALAVLGRRLVVGVEAA